ncbi:nicotinamide-nucleotide adenylyltransferase [Candidatus Woesearchaeota archaeon]|nr:nicotinamide-nucleotide adenylyltransferase [Candidatus Woesearchaeota archaeon]
MKRGLFVGRFQPFHLGHLQDINNALKEVDELVIGIGSSNEKNTKENPFSAKERIEMIGLALKNNKAGKYKFFTIPDFNDDKKWVEHIEALAPKFDVVYTGNEWTERCFKGKYEIRKVRILEGISSTIIRNRMLKNMDWQMLVPKEIADYVTKINGVGRVKEICN